MSTSRREETRTKLSGKATPFRPLPSRPSLGAISTSSSLGSSHSMPVQQNYSDLDSSTGSVGSAMSLGSWTPGTWTPPGQLQLPANNLGAPGWSTTQGFASDGQGTPSSPTVRGQGEEFKLGDFRSKLLKRAQEKTCQEPQRYRREVNFASEVCFIQALKSDTYVFPYDATGGMAALPFPAMLEPRAGDRRQAMNRCLQPLDPSEALESKTMLSEPRAPLQHAATFNEGASSHRNRGDSSTSNDMLPVRNTFIHFSEERDGPVQPSFQWSSAPAILMKSEFLTKWPAMEPAHLRGDCKPCVYFTKKQDGCRWGADCEFCHLCPEGSVQRKRREKNKEIRKQEEIDSQNRKTRELRRARRSGGYGTPT